jgi:8-oxo-dGTP pyrophosphatase MutT (NUDIX family)
MKIGSILLTAALVSCTTPQPNSQDLATVVRVRAIVGNVKEKTVLLGLTRDVQKWGTPGGALETGEDPKSAVLREVFEETGLGRSSITGIKLLQHDATRKTAVFGICINSSSPQFITTAGDKDKEFSELAWFKLGAFANNTYPDAIERANLIFAENDRSHFCGDE